MSSVRFADLVVVLQKTVEGGEPEAASGPPGGILLPLVAIFLIFYFLIIRPESKRRREREKKVRAAQKGDEVLTTGGIYGIVRRVGESDLELEIDKSNKVRVRFAKSAILDVVREGDGAAGGDGKKPKASKDTEAEPVTEPVTQRATERASEEGLVS